MDDRTARTWSRDTFRDYWLRLGGPKSKFGYPTEDETYTPDRRGRMSRFEHSEIW